MLTFSGITQLYSTNDKIVVLLTFSVFLKFLGEVKYSPYICFKLIKSKTLGKSLKYDARCYYYNNNGKVI